MNSKDAHIILSRVGNYLDDPRIREVTIYVEQLEAQLKSKDELLMEAYESIVESSYYTVFYCGSEVGKFCKQCKEIEGNDHSDNCIVNKAQDYINRESK